jgi:hypothetical protein
LTAPALAAPALAALLAGCGRGPWQEQPLLLPGDSFAFKGPEDMSPEQLALATAALRSGEPLPPWFEITDWCRTSVEDTGEVVPGTGERIFTLTIEDDPADLARVNVWVDGRLVQTATRAKGIVEHAGIATTTVRFSFPPKGQAFRWRIEFIGEDGEEVRSSEGSVAGLVRPWSYLAGWMFR